MMSDNDNADLSTDVNETNSVDMEALIEKLSEDNRVVGISVDIQGIQKGVMFPVTVMSSDAEEVISEYSEISDVVVDGEPHWLYLRGPHQRDPVHGRLVYSEVSEDVSMQERLQEVRQIVKESPEGQGAYLPKVEIEKLEMPEKDKANVPCIQFAGTKTLEDVSFTVCRLSNGEKVLAICEDGSSEEPLRYLPSKPSKTVARLLAKEKVFVTLRKERDDTKMKLTKEYMSGGSFENTLGRIHILRSLFASESEDMEEMIEGFGDYIMDSKVVSRRDRPEFAEDIYSTLAQD